MSRGAMEPEDEKKKKINDDLVVFMRKRSETEAPRYTARLKTYVDFKQKRRRAATARRHSGGHHEWKPNSASRRKIDGGLKDKGAENQEHAGNEEDRTSRSRRGGDNGMHRARSLSRSGTGEEPEDMCCQQRRRRKPRCPRKQQRRRRSCRPKRRRRSSRRRRRRSCSRRRRRRSACRRRRRASRRKPRRRC